MYQRSSIYSINIGAFPSCQAAPVRIIDIPAATSLQASQDSYTVFVVGLRRWPEVQPGEPLERLVTGHDDRSRDRKTAGGPTRMNVRRGAGRCASRLCRFRNGKRIRNERADRHSPELAHPTVRRLPQPGFGAKLARSLTNFPKANLLAEDNDVDRLVTKILLIASIAWLPTAAMRTTAADESGFSSIFNGRNLDGWQLRRADRRGYQVQEGILVCPQDGGGFLFSEEVFADFTLRFEFRLSRGANNGLAIRCPLVDRRPAYEGMELQILDNIGYPRKLKPTQYHGSLYGVAPAKRGALLPLGEWNAQEVTCLGQQIKVTLNGQVILDIDLDDFRSEEVVAAHPGLQRASGHIGFLGHGSRVEFRHIRIKRLEDSPRQPVREIRRFSAREAHQGVAIDGDHVYAVTNRGVGKYSKRTGESVARWSAPAASHLKHLNSGVVHDGRLYCAHSNWPDEPLKNSLEIFDTETLKHLQTQRLVGFAGALTWIDRHDDDWWVGLAHYGEAEDVSRTSVHRLNDQWQPTQSWTFPRAVIRRFVPYSNSGASFGPDGLLYATGHDRAEVYALRFPAGGGELELVDTLPVGIAGQGIAWDRDDAGVIAGIHRARKEVILTRVPLKTEAVSQDCGSPERRSREHR